MIRDTPSMPKTLAGWKV